MNENKLLPMIDLTPEQEARLRSAVRLLIEHLLEHKHLTKKHSLTNSVGDDESEDNSPLTDAETTFV